MIGSNGPFSRLVEVLRPADRRSNEEVMSVWLSPCRPRWDHIPVSHEDGPFRIVKASTVTDAIHAIDRYDHLGVAITNFVLRHLPAPDQSCALIDRHEMMLLGWHDYYRDLGHLHAPDERYAWFGCEAAFNMLEILHHHPVEVAFWSRLAHPDNDDG